MMIRFSVEVPTAGVNQWIRRSKSHIYTPKEYLAFRDTILLHAIKAKEEAKAEMITGPAQVSILAIVNNSRKDIDNFIKPVLDALQKAKVFKNDNLVNRLVVEKLFTKEKDLLFIEVSSVEDL